MQRIFVRTSNAMNAVQWHNGPSGTVHRCCTVKRPWTHSQLHPFSR